MVEEKEFDLSAVKKQAMSQLEKLTAQEDSLLAQLEELKTKKEEIQVFLGLKPQDQISRRNRYRTKVKEYFESCEDSSEMVTADAKMLLEELFSNDPSMMAGLKISMARIGKDDPNYSYNSSSETLSFAPKALRSAK